MTERTRREYLRDFGIAAGGISIAGCLGDGEDGESTPDSTPSETATEETAKDQETVTEQDNTTEEETDTTEGSSGNGYGLGMFRWVPSSMSSDEIGGLNYARPAAIAADINSEAVQAYDEENAYSPVFSDISMQSVNEAFQIGRVGGDFWVISDDVSDEVSQELGDQFEKSGEERGFEVYTGTVDMAGNENEYLVAFDGEKMYEVAAQSLPEGYMADTVAPFLERMSGEGEAFVEGTALGEAISGLEYEEGVSVVIPSESGIYNQDSPGEFAGVTYDFQSENAVTSNFLVNEGGEIERVEKDVTGGIYLDSGEYSLDHPALKLI